MDLGVCLVRNGGVKGKIEARAIISLSFCICLGASLVAQMIKNLPAMREI